VKDQEKSKDFYIRILGRKLIKAENLCYIKLANSWIILNCGGGPTPDKPEVVLQTPTDLNRVNAFSILRVADIWACYKQWHEQGAIFLRSRSPIRMAGNGDATCVIPTGTLSRSANILKLRNSIKASLEFRCR
jgi:hypothetical protein